MIKKLVVYLNDQSPGDDKIFRTKERVITITSILPTAPIDIVGKYLSDYGGQIFAKDMDFFLQSTYDTELGEGEDAENVDLVSYIIPKAKDILRDRSDSEKQAFIKIAEKLLVTYMDYVEEIGG